MHVECSGNIHGEPVTPSGPCTDYASEGKGNRVDLELSLVQDMVGLRCTSSIGCHTTM
jgi:hypothetical protein